MSNIITRGLYLCYDHKWEIIKIAALPGSVLLTLLFKQKWILDPYTNYPGIACATVLTTTAYVLSHHAIHQFWFRYWKQKNDKLHIESAEQQKVTESLKNYEEAQKTLEATHATIAAITQELERKTKAQQLKIAGLEVDESALDTNMKTALKNQKDFIAEFINPALKDLGIKEIDLESDELKKENRQISQFMDLEKEFEAVKQTVFELTETTKKLKEDLSVQELLLKRLEKEQLPDHSSKLEQTTKNAKFKQGSSSQLEDDLEKKRGKVNALESEKANQRVVYDRVRKERDEAQEAYDKCENEMAPFKSDNLRLPPKDDEFDPNSLVLKSHTELQNLLDFLNGEKEKAIASNRDASGRMKALEKFQASLKQARLMVQRNLYGWHQFFASKEKAIGDRKKSALEKSGVLSFSRTSPILSPEARKRCEESINRYFSQILDILVSYRILNLILEPETYPTHFDLPDWVENEEQQKSHLERFLSEAISIKDKDSIFPILIQLEKYLTKSDFDASALLSELKPLLGSLTLFPSEFSENYSHFKNIISNIIKNKELERKLEQYISIVGEVLKKRKLEFEGLDLKIKALLVIRNNKEKEFETQKFDYLNKLSALQATGKVIESLESQKKTMEEEKQRLASELEKIQLEIDNCRKNIGDAQTKIATCLVKLKENDEKKNKLEKRKNILALLVEKNPLIVSHLDQLKVKHDAYLAAHKLHEATLAKLTEERVMLKNSASDLKATQQTNIAERETKRTGLQEAEKELAKATANLAAVECTKVRFNIFLRAIDKCNAGIDFYMEKTKKQSGTQNKLDFQKRLTQLIVERINLAIQIQKMNKQKIQVGIIPRHLIDKVTEIDIARYQRAVCDLKRHEVEQVWRVSKSSTAEEHRKTIRENLESQEREIYAFFNKKIVLPPQKLANAQGHEQRCIVQALIALIDLIAEKIYVDVERQEVKPLNNPDIKDRLITHLTKMKGDVLNPGPFTLLRQNGNYEKDLVGNLIKALGSDQAAHKEPAQKKQFQSELTYFFTEFRLITHDYIKDHANMHDTKLPFLQAKLDLIQHLITKPYLLKAREEETQDKIAEYEKARAEYRVIKRQLRTSVQNCEQFHFKSKSVYKTYNTKRLEAGRITFTGTLEKICDLPFTEKVSYLIPAGVLLLAYYNEKMTKFSLFNGYLSLEAGKALWLILTIVHVYVRNAFPKRVFSN